MLMHNTLHYNMWFITGMSTDPKVDGDEKKRDHPARTNTYLPCPRCPDSGDNLTCTKEHYVDGEGTARIMLRCGLRTIQTDIGIDDYDYDPEFSATIDDPQFSMDARTVSELVSQVSDVRVTEFRVRLCFGMCTWTPFLRA